MGQVREQAVDRSRKLYILSGDTALGMRNERESHCAPTDVDIGVMVGTFGILGYPSDGLDPVEESGEGHCTDECAIDPLPSVESRRRGVYLVIIQHSHLPTV